MQVLNYARNIRILIVNDLCAQYMNLVVTNTDLFAHHLDLVHTNKILFPHDNILSEQFNILLYIKYIIFFPLFTLTLELHQCLYFLERIYANIDFPSPLFLCRFF